MAIRLKVLNFTENRNEKWRLCVNCGYYYPDTEMVNEEGRWYCRECHDWKYRKRRQDEWRPRLKDRPED